MSFDDRGNASAERALLGVVSQLSEATGQPTAGG